MLQGRKAVANPRVSCEGISEILSAWVQQVVSFRKAYALLAVRKSSHSPNPRSTVAVPEAAASASGMTEAPVGAPGEARTPVTWSYLMLSAMYRVVLLNRPKASPWSTP